MCDGVLKTYFYPCLLANPLTQTLVLLHGWGCDSRSWQPLIAALQKDINIIAIDLPGFGKSAVIDEFSLDRVLDLIAPQIPVDSILMGWSLGGMLAVQLAHKYPQKINKIITLAANVKFVVDDEYLTAMPLAINDQFNKQVATDAQAALKLFAGLLAQGDIQERKLLKQVRPLLDAEAINPNWLQALALLSSLDNRRAFADISQPGLHVFAEKDVLVPVAAAHALVKVNLAQCIKVVPDSAHAVHWGQPECVTQLIQEFIQLSGRYESVPDKKQMAKAFSRAAAGYDSVAHVQQQSGNLLLTQLQTNSGTQCVIDLGCGTGYFTPQLQARFPQARVIGVDIAEGMLQFVRSNTCDADLICADAESLPFADNSIDIIYSNFALQWCSNLPKLFSELQRILTSGGQLFFTTLAPATLQELKMAWQQVDSSVHVNHFIASEQVLENVLHNGFTLINTFQQKTIMPFNNLHELTKNLKSVGAHNVNSGRSLGLTGRKKIKLLTQAYEQFRQDGVLPLTYDVLYVMAKKQ